VNNRFSKTALAIAAALLLTSCGLKGELYLPETETRSETAEAENETEKETDNKPENKDDSTSLTEADAIKDNDTQ
jgi:predicted small lipoprotein YifL